MSNQRKRERHLEVLALRAEGREAAMSGKSRQTRHQYCDKMQWLQGYDDAMQEEVHRVREEHARQKDRELRALIREEIDAWWVKREGGVK